VQAEKERKAAAARQERVIVFMIESLFDFVTWWLWLSLLRFPVWTEHHLLVIIGFRGRYRRDCWRTDAVKAGAPV
jgi:hypothetical protein